MQRICHWKLVTSWTSCYWSVSQARLFHQGYWLCGKNDSSSRFCSNGNRDHTLVQKTHWLWDILQNSTILQTAALSNAISNRRIIIGWRDFTLQFGHPVLDLLFPSASALSFPGNGLVHQSLHKVAGSAYKRTWTIEHAAWIHWKLCEYGQVRWGNYLRWYLPQHYKAYSRRCG